jgi:hypothetical protein
MLRAILAVGGAAALLFTILNAPISAAELNVATPVHHARALRYCGPCGCLRVVYVYHRDIQSTYGTSYDARNYDTTEPHFYPGAVHAYPHYYVEIPGLGLVVPAEFPCRP